MVGVGWIRRDRVGGEGVAKGNLEGSGGVDERAGFGDAKFLVGLGGIRWDRVGGEDVARVLWAGRRRVDLRPRFRGAGSFALVFISLVSLPPEACYITRVKSRAGCTRLKDCERPDGLRCCARGRAHSYQHQDATTESSSRLQGGGGKGALSRPSGSTGSRFGAGQGSRMFSWHLRLNFPKRVIHT